MKVALATLVSVVAAAPTAYAAEPLWRRPAGAAGGLKVTGETEELCASTQSMLLTVGLSLLRSPN